MQISDSRAILEANYQKIVDFMNQERWMEAHRGCLEILRFDPENIKVIRLKHTIEKTVSKLNRKAVEKDLAELKPFWREKKYGELLTYLKKLEPYSTDYPELIDYIRKAQKGYNEQVYEEQEEHFKKTCEEIGQMARAEKYSEAIVEAEKLRLLKLHDEKIKKLLQKLRSEWIENEIKKNESFLKSEKYEDILLLYQKLKRIDDQSSLLEKLIAKTKKDYQFYKIDSKREFIYKGTENIRTLYQLKKYEKALQAAQEILEIDPTNWEIRSFLKKARKKTEQQIEKEVITQMLGLQKKYTEAYLQSKTLFRKI